MVYISGLERLQICGDLAGFVGIGRHYRRELWEGGTIDRRNKRIKNHGQKFTLRLLQHLAQNQTVTLLCHCAEDEPHCHRHLLKALLEPKAL